MFRFIRNDRWFYYLLFLVLNAIEMILELAASRVMSPYFGSSNFVWTAVIGIILLAASIGNVIGGKLSEEREVHGILFHLLFVASMFVVAIPLMVEWLLPALVGYGFGVKVNSVIASVVLFLMPSILIATVTPFIMKAQLSETDELGNESGKIHAIIAIGSLGGTFVGGFFLIPVLGTNGIILTLSLCLFVLSVLSFPRKVDKKKTLGLSASYVVLCVILAVNMIPHHGEEKFIDGISIDTEYSRIFIKDVKDDNGDVVRLYQSSGAYSSAMYVDRNTELYFDYTKKYNDAFKWSEIDNVLMIGGAAYSYPKYYISHFPQKTMTIVEIDPKAEAIAKKYFGLEDVINKYDKSGRLRLVTGDGRVFINENKTKFNAVFNDAFSGEIPVGTLATKEAVEKIYDSLSDDGIYMSNVIGSINNKNSWFMRSEIKTIGEVFPYVYVYRADGKKDDSYGNHMVVASKRKLDINGIEVEFKEKDFVITDDYCPVEQMVGDTYFEETTESK